MKSETHETTTILKVSGWHCEGCSSSTEAELKRLAGVKSVKTSVKDRTATVVYDAAKVTPALLEQAVATSGFKVEK